MTGHQSAGLRPEEREAARAPASGQLSAPGLVALCVLGGVVAACVGAVAGLLLPEGWTRTLVWTVVATAVALSLGFWRGRRGRLIGGRRRPVPGPPPGGPR
ncbi:hypothetical protein GCM10010389_59120 [Streptomyces echinoruber]|uniref:Uncharacterized protein n=1 Tax=Streptomyces echinoruber TaxID=68898 RepID=A0A918RWR8_9ACTN|nr:hypothetical protein GCM10010389_59120 [Streptomyces echinoruber]